MHPNNQNQSSKKVDVNWHKIELLQPEHPHDIAVGVIEDRTDKLAEQRQQLNISDY